MFDSVPIRKWFYKYNFLILLIFLFSIPIFSQSKEIQFLRTTDTALQTSVYTLISKDTNVRLKIIGVLHIADLEYYQNIQKIINDLDYLFYEGIHLEKTALKRRDRVFSIATEVIDENRTKKSIRKNSEFKNEIARFLNFADQLEHLKPKQNWINADMNFSQFMNVLNSYQVGFDSISGNLSVENRSIITDYLELSQLEPNNTPDYNQRILNFKKKMSQNLVKSCLDLCFLEETKLQRTAIITERNKVAISFLKPKFTSQIPLELGLLYGAAHTPNFVEILTHEYNFEIESYEWLDAWSLQN